tara:strand:+ start:20535 stop:20723 length:189 start_codon:yes stop_codon:yes gene_type:complete
MAVHSQIKDRINALNSRVLEIVNGNGLEGIDSSLELEHVAAGLSDDIAALEAAREIILDRIN